MQSPRLNQRYKVTEKPIHTNIKPGPHLRNPLRQLRPPLHPPGRDIPPRLRPNDGISLNRVLPVHPLARNLQPPRRQRHLQRLRELGQHLVRETARLRARNHGLGLESGGSHLPDHGVASDSAGRVRMGDEDLRVRDLVDAGDLESYSEVEVDAYEEVGFDLEFCQAAQGCQVCGYCCWVFLFLLGYVLAVHVRDYPGGAIWHVAKSVAVSHPDLERSQVSLTCHRVILETVLTTYPTSIFGRTLPGYMADRVGRYNVMIIFSYFSGILVLALWLPSRSNAPAIVFSALYGFGSGAFVSLAPALIAQISDLREVGVRNGTCFSIISFAALTGTPIGGALVPSVLHGSYTKLQVFCGVVMIAGATLFVVARVVVGGARLNKV